MGLGDLIKDIFGGGETKQESNPVSEASGGQNEDVDTPVSDDIAHYQTVIDAIKAKPLKPSDINLDGW